MTLNLKKYEWKARLLLIETPSYTDKSYIEAKDTYQKFIKDFHKRYLKLITNRNKEFQFNVKLVGFDGTVKKEFKELKDTTATDIIKIVDDMPFSKILENKEKYKKEYQEIVKNKKFKPINLSLFSDYNKENTVKGLGFKNKEKAIHTLNVIKDKPIKYQVSVVTTMIGRAKNHPNKTKDMEEALKIFEKWLDTYKNNKK